MNTAAEQPRRTVQRSSLSRWHGLFYLLVIFALFTVSFSLYLSHQFMRIHIHSVTVNQDWVERLHACSELGQLAANVNAPGNDVFQSHQIDAEQQRLEASLRAFDERAEAFAQEVWLNTDEAQARPLIEEVRNIHEVMREMAEEAHRLFAYLRGNQAREAATRMAEMDRHFARAIRVLESLRRTIATIQKQHFESQAEAATSLQRFQYGVAALILLMTAAALVYGHRVRRQVDAATREKEGYIQALQESEVQLDRRVRERTDELVQANRTLHAEIDERHKAESALRESEGRYRQLLKKAMSAQEDERRRIARDLHDEIGQALTSLLIGLRTVAEAPALDVARERTESLRRIAVSTLEEVRRLARGLRPSVLDDMGLTAALERYAADYANAHGVTVEFQASDEAARRLPEEVETALYRIVQEALTNAAKHAAARRIRVHVERAPGLVQVRVEDDGCGFDPGRADTGGRLGLSGIRERAALLSGTVSIESAPAHGTCVTVCIPVAEESHGQDSSAAGG